MLRSISYFFLIIMFIISGLYAQKTCMFVSAGEPDPNDAILISWLEEKSFSVTIATGEQVNSGYFAPEEFLEFDFIFISESNNSSHAAPLKGAPVPMFFTELWSTKTTVTGWAPEESSPLYYGTADEAVVKIVDGAHELAAGFSTGTEVTLVSDTHTEDSYLTYSNLQVEHIPIAVLTSNDARKVVFGIEKGTELYNDSGEMDGSVYAASRCAAVGIHAEANDYITDDGFALIEAGINWILDTTTTAIDEENIVAPSNFALEQNYPNPFNPSTNISFTLGENSHTLIKVYNILGQEVATLIDQNLNPGLHTIQFNGSELESGIYFYHIVAGDYKASKKMMLIK